MCIAKNTVILSVEKYDKVSLKGESGESSPYGNMRKTKIVCTLGPSTDDEKVLEQLINNGMNVARCNFSHGSHEEHKGRMDKVKKLRTKCDKPVALLLDTKGPEIRTGNFENDKIEVKTGQLFTLMADKNILGNQERVGVTYTDLYKDVQVGSVILIDDGLVKMEGKVGKVLVEINNINATGKILVDGMEWTARSKDGQIIKKDALVEIINIEGVKAIVKEREQED